MKRNIKELSMIALFPAMMGATAGIFIPLYSLPPITLQTFFVLLAGLLLPSKDAFLSIVIYVVLGLIGVPVFSGYSSGLSVILGPSGGFIIGFIFVAYLTSVLNDKISEKSYIVKMISIIFISTVSLYMIGGAYIAYIYKLPYFATLIGFSPYLIGDGIKAILVVILYKRLQLYITYERL